MHQRTTNAPASAAYGLMYRKDDPDFTAIVDRTFSLPPPPGEAFIEGSRTLMTVRTTSKTVTFTHPFNLSGMDEVQPAGTYTVETDEELLQTSSVPAYRRISTLMRLT